MEKRKYEPPKLVDYGSIRNLTGGSGNMQRDGGFRPNGFMGMMGMMGMT